MKLLRPSFYHISISVFAIALIVSLPLNARARHFRDTVHFKASVAEKKALVLSDSALNEIGIDSLLGKIENVHNTLDRINNATATGFDTRDIENNLGDIDSNIDIIDDNLSLYSSVLDVKNLQMFDVLLTSLQNQLSDWRTTVFKYNKDLADMNMDMAAFRRDTILKSLIADSAFRSLYLNEIKDLKSKWALAKKSISDNLTSVNHLQATLSNEYFTTIDLQNRIRDLLKKTSVKSMGKEYAYIWDINKRSEAVNQEAENISRKSYRGQRKILMYYFKRNTNDQLWMLFAGVIFFLWIFRNFRKLQKDTTADHLSGHSFMFIKKISILSTLVVLFNISPFFDIHPPTAYVEIMELLLVLTLTLLVRKNWPQELFNCWLVISVLYFIFSFTGALLTPGFGFRFFLLFLNISSVVFGIIWFRILKKHTLVFSGMIRFVSVVFIIMNFTATVCNIFGRLSLAKIFSVTSIYGLTQIIGLSIFIRIIMEAFHLQTIVTRLKGGFAANLNFQRIQTLLGRALIIVSVIIWSIVFTISLNIYNLLFEKTYSFLTSPHTVGNTTFEIGSILLFICIIYVSNLLQQGIGSLYGKEESNWDPEVKKNGSRLAMTRLIFIVLGFLIAVAASGLPMDKITIVLGALGVGIGLGLQTIVNNLVSGVILIFEQPFRIGDFIELGDIKGRVLDIGIRSSKIVREEGAEVIMPNADLLSGRVINWTLRNDNVRVELPISIEAGHPFEEVKTIILDELKGSEHVVKTQPMEIYLTAVSDKSMDLNVLLWIDDVHKQKAIKSQLLNSIYGALATKQIKIV
jgi:potassium efflux system protein